MPLNCYVTTLLQPANKLGIVSQLDNEVSMLCYCIQTRAQTNIWINIHLTIIQILKQATNYLFLIVYVGQIKQNFN